MRFRGVECSPAGTDVRIIAHACYMLHWMQLTRGLVKIGVLAWGSVSDGQTDVLRGPCVKALCQNPHMISENSMPGHDERRAIALATSDSARLWPRHVFCAAMGLQFHAHPREAAVRWLQHVQAKPVACFKVRTQKKELCHDQLKMLVVTSSEAFSLVLRLNCFVHKRV